MNSVSMRNKTVTNLMWRFAERCGAQGVAFVVSIVLARLLSPSDYGVIALVTVFTNILQVFVDAGLGSALIQKKNADDIDFSTVFFCNFIMCCFLYIGVFVLAPYIAKFYGNLELVPVIRVLSLTLVISGLKNVQQAYVSRQLLFKRFFFATLGGTIGAAFLGIVMAYLGFGVWALVAQQLFNALVDTIILWITVKWRPKLLFSFSRLRSLFSFGGKMLLASLISTVYLEIRQLIIGRIYSSSALAYYNKGKHFPHLVVTNINSSINSVLLPVMSNAQDDSRRVKSMTRRAIKTSSYIMWPMMFGLMAVGEPLIRVLMTEKWMPCVPYLYIFCIVYGMEPIHTANLNAIRAMGRSDLTLRMEIIKKISGIILILATMNISVLALGISSIVYTIVASIINAYPNKRLLNYTYLEQIKDMCPSLCMAIVMLLVVWSIKLIPLPDLIIIPLQIIVGVIIYVGMSILIKNDSFMYVKDTVSAYLEKKKIAKK